MKLTYHRETDSLYIDLVGFSIGFPLGPDLLAYYLGLEGHAGALGWMVAQVEAAARAMGVASYAPVLFGGVVASVFSILQFAFAPLWGGLSDRRGRRRHGSRHRRHPPEQHRVPSRHGHRPLRQSHHPSHRVRRIHRRLNRRGRHRTRRRRQIHLPASAAPRSP